MARRLFLERRTYRQYRLQDAARLMPVLGLILVFGPIFIREEGEGAPTLAGELVYYLAIWLGLIALTALLSRAMSGANAPDDLPSDQPEIALDPVRQPQVAPNIAGPSDPVTAKTQTPPTPQSEQST